MMCPRKLCSFDYEYQMLCAIIVSSRFKKFDYTYARLRYNLPIVN